MMPSTPVSDDPLEQALLLREELKGTNKNNIKELLEHYPELARMVLRGAPFAGRDLRGQDLTGLDFSGANLVGARFKGAQIAGARFDQARVARWQLREAEDWLAHATTWRPAAGRAPRMVIGGDRFSDAPFAPELMMIPPDPGGGGALDDLLPVERQALGDERLAVAILPVTTDQYGAFVRRQNRFQGWRDDGAERPRLLAPGDARHYLAWLGDVCAADYRIPSPGLWRYLARRGGMTEASAVTLKSHPGLTAPLPADMRWPPGAGRCDELGLIDMLGNSREFVLGEAGGGLMAIGGCFDESITRVQRLVERQVDQTQNTALNGLRVVRLFPEARD